MILLKSCSPTKKKKHVVSIRVTGVDSGISGLGSNSESVALILALMGKT